jgi:hypothetical protein
MLFGHVGKKPVALAMSKSNVGLQRPRAEAAERETERGETERRKRYYYYLTFRESVAEG